MGRTQSTVNGATPELVVLGSLRKQTEPKISTCPWSLNQLLSLVSSV